MTFTLLIKLGNAAMESPEDVARALQDLATKLDGMHANVGRIRDDNGNTVGWWSFE